MRRLTTALLAGLLLAGLLVQPAAAKRPLDGLDPKGETPHFTFALWAPPEFGLPEIVQVPTGEWVRIGIGWGTATQAQLDHLLDTVIVEAERNGVSQDVERVPIESPGGPGMVFTVLLEPGPVDAPQHWTMRWTFTEDHFDGFEVIPAGTVIDYSRTIVWTPRGQFPSAAYPCPNGEYPCVNI